MLIMRLNVVIIKKAFGNFTIFFSQLLLRKKAAEELKKEQERKAAERRKVIDERCGLPKDIDNASEGKLLLPPSPHPHVIRL